MNKDLKITLEIVVLAMFLFIPITFAQTITSVSKVEFISNDPVINGKAFLVDVTLEGSSQYLKGKIYKSNLDRVTTTPEKVAQGFELTFSLPEQTCRYPIESTGQVIYRLMYEKKAFLFGVGADNFINECQNKPYPYIWWGKKPWTWDYFCAWLSPEAQIGKIPRHILSFKTILTMKTDDGKIAKGTISNLGVKSLWLKSNGNNVVYAKWTGLLWSGLSCPAYEANYGAIWINGEWRIVDKSNIEKYLTNNDPLVLDKKLTYDPSSVETEASIWNHWTNEAETQATLRNVRFEGKRDIHNGQIIYIPNALLYYPTLNLRIKADWIGVVVPVGEPKITYLPSKIEFTTGETGYIEMRVKNNGYKSSFGFDIRCSDPISLKEPVGRIPFNSGEEKTVVIKVVGSTSKVSESAGCRITVYDVENPDKRDTGTVKVTVKKIITCQPEGLRECYGNRIVRVCENGEWKYYQCKEDEECKDGYCVKKALPPAPTPPTPTPTPPAPGTCEEARDKCLAGCGAINIPCMIGCWFEYFGCWIVRAVTQILIIIGAIVVIVLIIYIFIKFIAKPKIAPIPFPPFGKG